MDTNGVIQPKIELIEGEIGVVNLGPGDRLVLMFPNKLSSGQARWIAELMAAQLPGVPCLILDSGAKVGVIHETESVE